MTRHLRLLRLLVVLAPVAALSTAGCGGEDTFSQPTAVDVSGAYTVALTNGANTCMTMDSTWVEGEMSTGIPFTINQDGAEIWADAEGAAGILFALLTGETRFQGKVHGNDFTLTDFGSKEYTSDTGCTYTVNAVIQGTLTGNAIEGTVTYEPDLDSSAECADQDCSAVQSFSGSRPPPA